jgi:ABC-type phosphate transport system auxiliary subunit
MEPIPNQQHSDGIMFSQILSRLDRLDERTQNIATRSDLESLRKELVTRDAFEPQVSALRAQILRVDTDRLADRLALEKRIDGLEDEQISKQDRVWIRAGQVAGVLALALALFQLLSHVKLLP